MAIGTLIPAIPPIGSSLSQALSLYNASKALLGKKAGTPMWDVAFQFDFAGEVRYQGTSEITDHVMEDSSSIQDHIALKPIKVTLQGFAGLVAQTKAQLQGGILGNIQSLVGSIPAYAGRNTPGAAAKISAAISQAQNIAAQVNSLISQGKALLAMVKSKQNKIQQVFTTIEALRTMGTIFKLQLPFRELENMVVESMVAVEDAETHTMADFTITLKQVRTVSSVVPSKRWQQAAEGFYQQKAVNKFLGLVNGTDSPSVLSRVGSAFGVTV